MVVDTSALLAVVFNESDGPKVARLLNAHASQLRMSTVNLAETLILIEDRQPHLFEHIRAQLYALPIRYVPPSRGQAEVAASARLRFPLNLGDCFAYALAFEEGSPLLTLDKDFATTDIKLVEVA